MTDKRNAGPVHIAEALQQFMQRSGTRRTIEAQQVILEWEVTVGAHLARAATPLRISHGVLTVRARNAVWRVELKMRSTELMKKINAHFGAELVKSVVVR